MKCAGKMMKTFSNIQLVDSHFHLWNKKMGQRWLTEGDYFLNTVFGLREYKAATSCFHFKKIVHAETITGNGLAEAKWIDGHKAEEPRLAAQIAEAALENGVSVREELKEMMKLKNVPVKSIRRSLSIEHSEFTLSDKYNDATKVLYEEFNLPSELEAGQSRQNNVNMLKFVKRHPKASFLLNHAMKPDIERKNQRFPGWHQLLEEFASQPNMKLKLAGSAPFHNQWDFTQAEVLEYLQFMIKTFGFQRIIVGTDFPVVLQTSNVFHLFALIYQAALNVGASEEDFKLMFQKNAETFYGI